MAGGGFKAEQENQGGLAAFGDGCGDMPKEAAPSPGAS